MKTVAAILFQQEKPLVIDEVDIPIVGYGQVLVEVKTTRICGSQLGEIDGVKGPDKYLPHLLGHEGGGIVLEVGPEVTRVKPGERVVMHWRRASGIQARTASYRRGCQTINAGSVTTFQNLSVVSENRLTPIPDDVDFEVASLLADTLTTGFGVVTRDARVLIGESVVVIGIGGIGLGTVLGARLAGAHPIVAVDLFDQKLAKACEFGATHVVNSGRENLVDSVSTILGSAADAVFDWTGDPEVIGQAWKMTGSNGRLVLAGVMKQGRQFCLNTLPLHFGKSLIGSEGGSSIPDVDIPRYVRLMKDSRLNPHGMISNRVSLSKINDAIGAMRSGETLHTLIRF